MSYYPCNAAYSLDQQLSYPHYSDSRWDTPQTIYGRKPNDDGNPDIHWNYNDRLWYDGDKHKRAQEKVSKQKDNTARYWLEYLKAYWERNIDLLWIAAGSNRSNGYPYWIFAYRFLDEKKNNESSSTNSTTTTN